MKSIPSLRVLLPLLAVSLLCAGCGRKAARTLGSAVAVEAAAEWITDTVGDMIASASAGATRSDVIELPDGMLKPASGYLWRFPEDPEDTTVVWNPGEAHDLYSYVVASESEGGWRPAMGYAWDYPDDESDFSVRPPL